MGLFAIFSGTLYALKSFVLPAFAGVVFNGGIVIVTLLMAPPLHITPALETGIGFDVIYARPAQGIMVVAMGWVMGALAQMLLQLPGLRQSRLRFTLDWRHPALRSILLLYAPVMFSLIMDTLVIRPVSYNLASQTGDGSISYMNWATTLIQFPQGLVATAISIAILPTLARQAALVKVEGLRAFRDTLGLGLRLATTLIIPAAVGLFIMAVPIIVLLFEHGAFTSSDTQSTALALRLYLLGLPFAAIDLLLVYAFYARKDTLTPALVGVLSLGVYMLVASGLLDAFGLYSLMIADSVKHVVHALVCGYLLLRRMGGFGEQKLILTLLKTTAAALVMGVLGWLTLPALASFTGTQGVVREALLVALGGALYGGVFLALAMLLRIDELRWLFGLVWRRLAGR
jgi:putative peptidoglycan lipid II flippase